MGQPAELPIALRRTPRKSVDASASTMFDQTQMSTRDLSKTPTQRKGKKRVRFSDPGPELEHHDMPSTGLTPMVRRSSLGAAPSPKRRRQSTPARMRATYDYSHLDSPNNEIRFLSLRQVLDDRVKRRIRRNGLSEEMNSIAVEKRRRAKEQNLELQRLRDEMAEKDAEIERLHDTTLVQDTERILELERQVEELRTELNNRSAIGNQTEGYDWTLAAKDPFSDSYMMDEGFGDNTAADFVCSTPSRARTSFPTPPSTSPLLPQTPCSMRRTSPTTPQSHSGVQVSFPDPEQEALEEELGSLRLELAKLTDTLESHAALKARLSEKLASAPQTNSDPTTQEDIENQLGGVLQALSDRTAALLDLNTSLSSLGFPGNDASGIISSLSGAFRSARLELEYLTPGEITIPLSSHGAEVLDLVLARLRDLARKVREDEEAIDEYHSQELSLRQQLGARVEAMDGMNRELKRGAAQLHEKETCISELQVGIDRLKGAVEGYRRDITELETLVQRMEAEAHTVDEQARIEREASKHELESKQGAVAELEAKLASVVAQTGDLTTQLGELQEKRAAEAAALNRSHGAALAKRDTRVSELRLQMDGISAELRQAHDTIRQLRVENGALTSRIDTEKRKAKDAIDSMKAELERVLQMSSEFLKTPKKSADGRMAARRISGPLTAAAAADMPESPLKPGNFLAGDLARTGKGKKRRRYDSGLGFMDEDEMDA